MKKGPRHYATAPTQHPSQRKEDVVTVYANDAEGVWHE
jgi:hypothetical protein